MEPTAIIVVVGNEILSGDVADSNSPWLAKELHQLGVEVQRIVTIQDRVEEIAETIAGASARYDLVLVTGGIGPTPDDVTRQGVAIALGLPLEFHPDAERILIEGHGGELDEGLRAMAQLPRGCCLVLDDLTWVTGFAISNVYVFPGVPEMVKRMFSGIRDQLKGSPIYRESFVTRLRESAFAEAMAQAMVKYPSVSIGSYVRLEGGGYQAELVFRSRDREALREARSWLEQEISALQRDLSNF